MTKFLIWIGSIIVGILAMAMPIMFVVSIYQHWGLVALVTGMITFLEAILLTIYIACEALSEID